VLHRTHRYLNNRLEQDHRGSKQRYYPMRGFGSVASAARFCRTFDEVRQFFRMRTTMKQKVSLAHQCEMFRHQVDSFRKALNMLPHDMLMSASDVFWPCDRQHYLEEFVYPQLATFEAAATLACGVAGPGSHERVLLRRAVFHDNALEHWQIATKGRE
jgi:hypothetical protein